MDVIKALRDAQGDAEKVTLAQTELRARMTQAEVDLLSNDPGLTAVAEAIDQVRAVIDATPGLSLLPEPFRTILLDARRSIDVADDALAPLGL